MKIKLLTDNEYIKVIEFNDRILVFIYKFKFIEKSTLWLSQQQSKELIHLGSRIYLTNKAINDGLIIDGKPNEDCLTGTVFFRGDVSFKAIKKLEDKSEWSWELKML